MTTESTENVPHTTHVVPRPKTGHGPGPARPEPGAPPPGPGRAPAARRAGREATPQVAADSLAAVGTAWLLGALTARPLPVLVVLGVWAVFLTLGARADAYLPGLRPQAATELPALLARALLAWCVPVALTGGAWERPDWRLLLPAVLLHTAAAGALRAVGYFLRRREARRRPRPTLLVGAPAATTALAGTLSAHPRYGLRPVGTVDLWPGRAASTEPPLSPLPVLRSPQEVARALTGGRVTDVVLAQAPGELPQWPEVGRLLAAHGVTCWLLGPDAHLAGRRSADHVWGHACRRLAPLVPAARAGAVKRVLDLLLVTPALVLALPVMAGCALALRLSDGPGVVFRQERVGRHGRPFTVLKFRTLRPADDYESATRWSVADDRRMSRTGALLRRTSLDELPQLWNVLRGDMSLVGPRPERPYFVQQFTHAHAGYGDRHRMPVGITGLAQTHGLRGDTSIADRARFDNHYIDTWSLWQDLHILWRTAASVLRLEGR
ncbi:sugar transferase [Streptomyces sp. NPDC059740]|uniref:sugar transferase n=1 Tax=Streptomyces sp. NPDC059740 TaxID=3346926 RepID=UPI003658A426